MPSLRGVRRVLHELYDEAPMSDFEDFDDYWAKRGTLDYVFPRWELAAAMIPDGACVLDLGCGSGDFLRYLRFQRPNIRATGSDSSQAARDMTADAGFDVLDLDAMTDEIPTGFDYITAFEILEHLPDAEGAITRWANAAGVELILSVPNVGHFVNRVRLGVFGRFPLTNCVYHIKEHLRHWTPTDFAEWTSRLNLDLRSAHGQYGIGPLWRRYPALFAYGMVYVVAARDPDGG